MVGAIIIPIFTDDEETEAHCEGITGSYNKRQSQDLNTAFPTMMSVFLILHSSIARNKTEG